jgi:cytochrome c biogenesis protein CcdA/thiol-disulfide isomerase/thioredoxin
VALLLGFAFVAGFATCLTPCVLPVLPAVLSGAATGGRARPLGIVTGLVLSFTFATIALVYVLAALGLPNNVMRTFAVVVLLAFGGSLLVPRLSARFEAWLSRFGRVPPGTRGGLGSGVILGFGLGFLYAPCAGPILAGVITVSAAQTFTAGRLAVALAYALGSALALYAIMLGGRRLAAPLVRRSVRVQQVLGALMIAVAVLVYADVDVRFQTAVASKLPDFLTQPAQDLQESSAIAGSLSGLGAGAVAHPAGLDQAERGSRLPDLGAAPEVVGTQQWFNTPGGRPLSIRKLTRGQGRVVLIDFWTYTCINCIRTFPHLRALDERYRDDGLTIIGVHAPEFPFEKDAGNVAAAIDQNQLAYPVVQDNDLSTWDAFHNAYWPADYLIDARAHLRYVHFGEGDYEAGERAVRSLLAEAGRAGLGSMAHVQAERASRGVGTPESYLGAARAQGFVNGLFGDPVTPGHHFYRPPDVRLPPNSLAYRGGWTISADGATAGARARLDLRFQARRVFLVMGSPEVAPVRVLLDGEPLPDRLSGDDVREGTAKVDQQRLYRLVDLPRVEGHLLTLKFAPGISGYAFTFG